MTDADRLAELETKSAFADDLLQTLNDVVVRQERMIEQLERRVAMLEERLRASVAAPEMLPSDQEPPPPHY
ncbi:MAG: SlyX family protein [Pseudomonadota bacterium]